MKHSILFIVGFLDWCYFISAFGGLENNYISFVEFFVHIPISAVIMVITVLAWRQRKNRPVTGMTKAAKKNLHLNYINGQKFVNIKVK